MAVIKFHESVLQSLVQGCIELDRGSQKKFYMNFYGYAITVCNRYIHKEDDAIEVLNDGFLKIFRELKRFEPRHNNYEASLKGWMRRIFINTAVDQCLQNRLVNLYHCHSVYSIRKNYCNGCHPKRKIITIVALYNQVRHQKQFEGGHQPFHYTKKPRL